MVDVSDQKTTGAKTYVLDSYFREFVNKNKLPGWFIDAIKVVKTVQL